MPIILFSATVFICSLFAVNLQNHAKVSAVTGADWHAGRIIDDYIFTNKSDMTVSDIQTFLNQKVGTAGAGHTPGVCDTNGGQTSELGGGTRAQYGAAHGNPAPFTCLKDYYEVPKTGPGPGVPANNYGGKPIPAGAVSAAQMIWNAAQQYNISPRVLLVTIQKESAGPLITDDWPLSSQYTYAMGADCPDSGPNHSANCDPNYAGFSIQIAESAGLLRWYLDNMNQSWWTYKKPGNNAIQYHPNPACGAPNVFIETMATAALYTYTPYQPNATALSNLYGSQTDGCSSYGNRNFWRIFNDWFGNPVGPGYEFVDAINPTSQVNPNDVVNARIRIRNRSGATWYGDGNVPAGQHAFRLATFGYENTPYGNPSDPAWLGTSNQIRMVEASVPDGGIATFNFTFRAPLQQVNNYWTRFAPVLDGVKFFPYIGLSFTTFTPTPIYSYQVTGTTGLTNDMPTGFTAPVSYTIQNTGNVVWFNDTAKPAGTFALRLLTTSPFYHASAFYDPSTWLATNQIKMNDSRTSPGASTTFSFNLKTPTTNDTYAEHLGLVLDGAIAYPDVSQMNFTVKVSDYKFSVLSNNIPSSLISGQKYSGKIVLQNTGTATWYADGNTPVNTHAIRLMTPGYASHPFADRTDSDWLGTTNQIKLTTPSVAPGQSGEFNFDFIAPYNVSSYNSVFQLVLDGVYIVPDFIQKNTSIASISPSYTQQPGGIHPSLSPLSKGQVSSGKLIVRNTSNFVWYNDDARPPQFRGGAVRVVMANPYYRSSPFSNADASWLGTRNQIKMTTPIVNPGENAVFDYSWTAPNQVGTYHERFTLVLDGYALFPDIGMELVTTVQ